MNGTTDHDDTRQFLEIAADRIPSHCRLSLDVTQGLRHHAFLFYALALYLSKSPPAGAGREVVLGVQCEIPRSAFGVLPQGLVQYPWARIASIMALQFIRSPRSASTRSAAATSLIFSAGGALFLVRTFFTGVVD